MDTFRILEIENIRTKSLYNISHIDNKSLIRKSYDSVVLLSKDKDLNEAFRLIVYKMLQVNIGVINFNQLSIEEVITFM